METPDEKNKGGRPALYNTPDELKQAIEAYFMVPEIIERKTKAKGIERINTGQLVPRDKVTISGLAYHLGFESRQSFYDYEDREGFSYIIKKARLRVEMSYEERLADPACTGAIFALKNMGWRDKQETEHSGSLGITWNEQKTYDAPQSETDPGA